MKIRTTHVGSLPRPGAHPTGNPAVQRSKEEETRSRLATLVEKQVRLGLTYINNGELPRSDYVRATVQRFSGFAGAGFAPLPRDMEDLPEYSRRFGSRNGLITLNPKAPVKLPACNGPLSYVGRSSLEKELEMILETFEDIKRKNPGTETELFFTSPSPGTLALFLENHYYSSYADYVQAVSQVLRKEYEIIQSRGLILQIDCPDLAMGRHTRFKELSEEAFLSLAALNVEALNQALRNLDRRRCRVHICWGNYPGSHHHDIGLEKIFETIMGIDVRFVSLEASNHRHGHEWELFKTFSFPQDKVLMPGVIDTTSAHVEHPQLVAQRILNYVKVLGPDRVVASTDCGFASTASAAGVPEEIAWLKLESLVAGARLAHELLEKEAIQ